MARVRAARESQSLLPPVATEGPVHMSLLAVMAMRERVYAAAIDAAIVVAERPDQTVPQLITAQETLQQVGVGRGGWQSLVQHMPGYGLPLQEAIARMGACLACMRWRIATQAMSAVDGLLAAGGDVRETTEFKDLSEAFSVLHRLEYAGHLRGLTAGGLIMRVRSLHTRMQRGYSPLRMLRL